MNINTIFEDLAPAPSKKAVLVIGRFNPPHCGHGRILSVARKAFKEHKVDAIFVAIVEGEETSKNKKRNPLSGETRVKFMEASKFGKGLKYTIASNAYEAMKQVRDSGYEPLIIVGGKGEGDNRAETYKGILDKYFKKPDGSNINHIAISVERDTDSDDEIAGISGSIVRAAVLADRYEDFADMVCLDTPELKEKIYKELRIAMGLEE